MIKFGTDGWRAVISDQFTFENVRIVAQAIADYVVELGEDSPVVMIGYDTRFLSDKYGVECARVLAGNGIKAILADRVTPTPALSYAIKSRKAAGGIMVTASHNPYQYNGIKYKAGYGGSALPEIINCIEAKLGQQQPKTIPLNRGLETGLIEYFDPEEAYFAQLRKMVDLPKIVRSGLKVVIDPMHGAGGGAIKKLLAQEGMEFIEIRGQADPLFGGVNPEPISHNLQALADAVIGEQTQAGFATDGDADRVGAMDAKGNFVNSHIIYALLLRYLISVRKWSGGVVKTFSTSRMIDKLAAKYSVPIFETPIGFKYICELFLKEDILLGGEESGGIGFKNHVPERDGILCSLLLMEIMAHYDKGLDEIVEEMMQEIGHHYYDRVDLHVVSEVKDRVMGILKENPPMDFAGVMVSEILTLDGVKFMLEDGSWILFRASGTEPVVRIYVEAGSEEMVDKIITEGQRCFKNNDGEDT